MLGDMHRVERRALSEIVGAAEQRERVVAAGHLADPADQRDIQTCGLVRASSGVIGRSNSATRTTA